MPAADSRRARENRQSLFGKLRTRTRGAEVQRNNGAGGSSDIEGKAAMGSGERAGKRASFNGTVERNGRSLIRRVFFDRLSTGSLLGCFASAAVALTVVNFLEVVCDNLCRGRAAMNLAADV